MPQYIQSMHWDTPPSLKLCYISVWAQRNVLNLSFNSAKCDFKYNFTTFLVLPSDFLTNLDPILWEVFQLTSHFENKKRDKCFTDFLQVLLFSLCSLLYVVWVKFSRMISQFYKLVGINILVNNELQCINILFGHSSQWNNS